jgi:hypothetical protein
MYDWKIKFGMKSGKEIVVKYASDKNDSAKVAEEIFHYNVWYGFRSIDDSSNTFVLIREVESVDISPLYPDTLKM